MVQSETDSEATEIDNDDATESDDKTVEEYPKNSNNVKVEVKDSLKVEANVPISNRPIRSAAQRACAKFASQQIIVVTSSSEDESKDKNNDQQLDNKKETNSKWSAEAKRAYHREYYQRKKTKIEVWLLDRIIVHY